MAKYEQDARALEATAALVWLVEVEIPTTPDLSRLRLTTNNEPVTFGAALDGTPRIFKPFPMKVGAITRTKEGDLPQIQVAVANAEGVVVPYLETYRGLVGQKAVVQLVSLAELSDFSASLRFDGEIVAVEMDSESATLSIGAFNAQGMVFPKNRHVAEHCRFLFGSNGCGYNLNHPLRTFTTCPRTFRACIERGDDEENVMGVKRQHPDRWGGFRGIPG